MDQLTTPVQKREWKDHLDNLSTNFLGRCRRTVHTIATIYSRTQACVLRVKDLSRDFMIYMGLGIAQYLHQNALQHAGTLTRLHRLLRSLPYFLPFVVTVLTLTCIAKKYLLIPSTASIIFTIPTGIIMQYLVCTKPIVRAWFILVNLNFAVRLVRLAIVYWLLAYAAIDHIEINLDILLNALACGGKMTRETAFEFFHNLMTGGFDAVKSGLSGLSETLSSVQYTVNPIIDIGEDVTDGLRDVASWLSDVQDTCALISVEHCNQYFAGHLPHCLAIKGITSLCSHPTLNIREIEKQISYTTEALKNLKSEFRVSTSVIPVVNAFVDNETLINVHHQFETTITYHTEVLFYFTIVIGLYSMSELLYLMYTKAGIVLSFFKSELANDDAVSTNYVKNTVTFYFIIFFGLAILDYFLFYALSYLKDLALYNSLTFGGGVELTLDNEGGYIGKKILDNFIESFSFAKNVTFKLTFDDCFENDFLPPSLLRHFLAVILLIVGLFTCKIETFLTRHQYDIIVLALGVIGDLVP